MRIVLADPPQKQKFYDLSYANLGILYLIGYLRHHLKGAVEIHYLEGHHTLVGHLQELARLKPDLYGLSFAYPIAPLAYETIDSVKKAFPALPVVCGGPHPTSSPEDVLRRTKADVCVVGEGEEALLELAKHFGHFDGSGLSSIAGIVFRAAANVIERTPKRPYIRDLDSIPFPAWDVIDVKRYDGMHFRKSFPFGYVLASRGCPFDCTFCSNPVWKINKPWLRLRGPANIAAEIDWLYRLGAREIWFTSDELNPNLRWAMELCELVAKLGHKDLYLQCHLRADKITDEFAEALRRMNCWMVHLGVESANQRVLDGIGKHFTIEQLEQGLAILKRHKLKVDCYMMLYQVWEENGKLCHETPEEVANSLRFCWKHFLKGQLHYMSWQVATPYPGSRLHDIASRHCVLNASEVPADVWDPVVAVPGVSDRQIRSHVRQGILLKDLMVARSGNVSLKAFWRFRENLRYIFGLGR